MTDHPKSKGGVLTDIGWTCKLGIEPEFCSLSSESLRKEGITLTRIGGEPGSLHSKSSGERAEPTEMRVGVELLRWEKVVHWDPSL